LFSLYAQRTDRVSHSALQEAASRPPINVFRETNAKQGTPKKPATDNNPAKDNSGSGFRSPV
jgi:hypothetical protein